MNTFELELLSAWDERETSEVLVEFVRQRRRLPSYDDLVEQFRAKVPRCSDLRAANGG
jgi:hypothetical protein